MSTWYIVSIAKREMKRIPPAKKKFGVWKKDGCHIINGDQRRKLARLMLEEEASVTFHL